ncbi:hypothetical protein AJ80_01078 [Polytolypa hystricis UAMH7299]|uniref:ubiquitinyl hydrolase 1 n=1 Tax=Polytolypa hystricis (strain UAMH7299) TaxID=1447883 RepID=A0A2B7Z217_POLH7|nr:hypothetical protein AJ80_01078 [Polytolypa hystricis UAMH7299]
MAQLTDSDMVVDEYEADNNDRADVVLVSPSGSASEPEPEPQADDYDAMMARVLPADPDLVTEDEAHFTWHIQGWSKMRRKEHSPSFQCGGSPWRILFFPYGNQVDHASFYLEHGFEGDVPQDWYSCVQFALVLWNRNDPSLMISHVATHRFNSDEADWGFTRFCELRRLFNHSFNGRGISMVENDEACITAYVRVVKDPTGVLWHSFQNYNSKKETGMVGLRNQGATCYLNSLLQSLYFTNSFRKAVYQIPTDDDANKSNSAWTLQRLFYSLQTSDNPVSTQELTSSFGWESRQIFEQQDVQELSRKLMERLEEKMKGTRAEKSLPNLFVGKTKTYISCINVNYESSRIEDFWDIQLNVRGNATLDDSFKDYIQVETLDGENKYQAGAPYGLQAAKKGVLFESFPPVLHLHLKRFEYDVQRDAMMKINDRHEFPEEFDASPYLSEDVDKSEPWTYQLYGVLVHSGDFNAGHYYAFLRPTKDGVFYKFDDDKVIRATSKEVLEENFGGEYPSLNGNAGVNQQYAKGSSTKRSMNAYMLVYIRKSRIDDVLVEVQKEDIPSHIETRLQEERAEWARKKKEREEQHLYMNVGIISTETFKEHHDFDLTLRDPEPDDPSGPKTYRILRKTTVEQLAKDVAEEISLKPEQVRFWVMVNRQNKTSRPDQALKDPSMTIEDAFTKFGSKGYQFRLFMEVGELDKSGNVAWPEPQGNNSPILVFLKHFDVVAQTLTGVDHVFVRKHSKVADIGSTILSVMGWPAGTQFQLYEEIKRDLIEPMKAKQTFQQSEIQDGDIICVQRTVNESDLPSTAIYTDARQYYNYLLNRMPVAFAPLTAESGEETFKLTLSRTMSYQQWSTKVGEHLKIDPTHLRFAPVAANTGKPRPFIKRTVNLNLLQILCNQYSAYGYNAHRTDALYYEILDASLSEYETKKLVKVNWLSDGIVKEEMYEVLVAKNGHVSDLLLALQKKAKFEDETMQNLHVFEAYGGKIYKELPENFSVAGIADYVSLYVEPLAEEERNMEEGEYRINAYNFDKEPNKPHGIPFKFVVKPGEVFKETKERLSKRTGIRGKQFEKIRFAIISRALYSKPRYLEDDDILSDISKDPDDLLGLDHVNKNRNAYLSQAGVSIR